MTKRVCVIKHGVCIWCALTVVVGAGKTTLLREISRQLADEYRHRVVIIDTSNEIGGDGDKPNSCIGRARRMQVRNKREEAYARVLTVSV